MGAIKCEQLTARSIPKWCSRLSVHMNRWTCGPTGYSMCARFWRWRKLGLLRGRVLVKLTDKLFWFDQEHCRKAYYMRVR